MEMILAVMGLSGKMIYGSRPHCLILHSHVTCVYSHSSQQGNVAHLTANPTQLWHSPQPNYMEIPFQYNIPGASPYYAEFHSLTPPVSDRVCVRVYSKSRRGTHSETGRYVVEFVLIQPRLCEHARSARVSVCDMCVSCDVFMCVSPALAETLLVKESIPKGESGHFGYPYLDDQPPNSW